MSSHGIIPAEPDEASSWIGASLAQGSALALGVAQRLSEFNTAWIVASEMPGSGPVEIDDQARGIRTADADTAMQWLLALCLDAGLRTLIVEDDLARRGDRQRPLPFYSAFLGDRVLRWVDLAETSDGAIHLLRSGASGYPLNAYLCVEPGVMPTAEGTAILTAADVPRLVTATCAVIASVYDAETYVVLMNSEIAKAIVDKCNN